MLTCRTEEREREKGRGREMEGESLGGRGGFRLAKRRGSVPMGVSEAETRPRLRSLLPKVDCSSVSPLHLSSLARTPG